jgi:SAM-dependent methyltransferase
VSQTYADVDASADPVEAIAWQERMGRWPVVQAYKSRTYDVLAEADRIVDIGCGTGVDVIALGPQRCVGVESSAAMTEVAEGRGSVVCRADAHALPFPDGAFTGARADRVLQHLTDPFQALREMARVVSGGGRVVIAEPDQESLVIHVPGVRQSILDRLKALRRDVGYRHGRLISTIPESLHALGLQHVSVRAFSLALTEPDDAFGLAGWPQTWRADGAFTDDELDEWNSAIGSDDLDGFLYVVTFLVVAAVKP